MTIANAVILSGNANLFFAQGVCKNLESLLGKIVVKKFSDGEVQIEILENVRRRDVFVIQATCPPVNENLMELLLILDACRRASARSITAVIPYFGYARQDKKVKPRVPVSARLIADFIEYVGADRVITMDLHAGQIQGFFRIPVDNLWARPIVLEDIKSRFVDQEIVIVSADAGGVERARSHAKKLDVPLAIIDKRRSQPNVAKAMHVIGSVDGKNAIIMDDMADTAGTLMESANALADNGAKSVHAYVVHGILSGPAIERINQSAIESITTTDTVPLGVKTEQCKKLRSLSVANLFAEAMKRSLSGESVSCLFE